MITPEDKKVIDEYVRDRYNHRPKEEVYELLRTTTGRKLLEQERVSNRLAAALAEIKAKKPDVSDERARQIEARYPIYTTDSHEWPLALATWVEHQVQNKKKLTERQRRTLAEIAFYIREHSDDYLVDSGHLVKLMRAAYLIGVYCPAPNETLKRIKAPTGERQRLRQKRLEIIKPLLARAEKAYPDAGSYALAKNIKDDVNRQLRDYTVEQDTIRTDIDRIFKARKPRR